MTEYLIYLIPIALSNVLTEQTIGRNLVYRIFPPQRFLYLRSWEKPIQSILTCWACATFWASLIFLGLEQSLSPIQILYTALINVLAVDIIQKFKK